MTRKCIIILILLLLAINLTSCIGTPPHPKIICTFTNVDPNNCSIVGVKDFKIEVRASNSLTMKCIDVQIPDLSDSNILVDRVFSTFETESKDQINGIVKSMDFTIDMKHLNEKYIPDILKGRKVTVTYQSKGNVKQTFEYPLDEIKIN